MKIKELINLFEENFREFSELLRQLEENSHQRTSIQLPPDSQISLGQLANLEDEIIELRLKKILKEEHPYIPQINMEEIKSKSPYERLPMPQISDHFLKQKKELLKLLYSLPSDKWNRTGVHEMEGHVAFKEFIRRMTVKDRQILGHFKSAVSTY